MADVDNRAAELVEILMDFLETGEFEDKELSLNMNAYLLERDAKLIAYANKQVWSQLPKDIRENYLKAADASRPTN